MIYWVHAFLSDEDQNLPNGNDRRRLSYALAKVQWNFDRSGSFLSTSVRDESVQMGQTFLLQYQALAVRNLEEPKKNWKIVPKFHSFLHMLQYVKRTSRNPRLAGIANQVKPLDLCTFSSGL